ncbi:uncharacterized protein LOC132277889 isoform X2 [Cornus florida]|uniref:uncharacterized protein LOC132277889 isoform X2 n=1 Tax=Cornus florida TaxID=4283 RepID=UPI002897571F|nr:uncharacterized protein LOC132277889 isoform X2 [Cornus florida]
MEFKFQAIDDQGSTYFHSSSSMSFFTEQALRAGYRRNDVREAILREIEKERIREEIIAEEISRKRLLEAEVRREMLMEREMALRRADGISFLPPAPGASSSTWFEPRLSVLHQSDGRLLEERLALSLEERLSYSTRREIGGLETVPFHRKVEPKISEIVEPKTSEIIPFQRKVEPKISEMPFQRKMEPKISEIKPLSEAKPDGSYSGSKRKTETPPAAGERPTVGPKKKPKEEWSCALCQVSATNEQGLNEHLQGKKHKAREANLIAQRTGKNFTIGLFPKRTSKPTKLTGDPNTGKSMGKESLQFNKTREALLQKKPNTIKSEIPLQHHDVDDLKKKNGEAVQKMQKNRDFKMKRFKFWCEMCQIGAYSEKVMETHRKGKKHVGRLQELNKNCESDAGTQMAETIQNAKGAELAAKDEEKETTEDVGLADGLEAENHQASAGVAACGTN